MGQAPTRIVFFIGKAVFFCDFCVVFCCCTCFKKKKMDRRWAGCVWPIRVFLGFWDFFNLKRPLRLYRVIKIIVVTRFPPLCFSKSIKLERISTAWCVSISSSLGQSHVSDYRRSLTVSRTIISYSVCVVILGVCPKFKPYWMFQIYKSVIKGHEEVTSCSSLMHSYLFPLLEVLYRQVGNLSFGQSSVPSFVMAASTHIVAAIQEAGNTMRSSYALSQLSRGV